ncbi:MAG: UvrB/UvrC motif-containing protein [Candidatus Pacebacteria bacterium]|nr:UvrB/UvrC motif-containing protein [Candidatus Paceibacterota bacterium]
MCLYNSICILYFKTYYVGEIKWSNSSCQKIFIIFYLLIKNKNEVVQMFFSARQGLAVKRKDLVYEKIIKIKEREMNRAVKELDFETAAILRDEIGVLRVRMEK